MSVERIPGCVVFKAPSITHLNFGPLGLWQEGFQSKNKSITAESSLLAVAVFKSNQLHV